MRLPQSCSNYSTIVRICQVPIQGGAGVDRFPRAPGDERKYYLTKYHKSGKGVRILLHNKYVPDYGIFRKYTENQYKLTALRAYRQRGFEDDTPRPEKGSVNDEKLDNNLSRARSKVFEYALCNDWEWFVTFTLDQQKYDRFNLKGFIKDLSQFIRDYRKKHHVDVKYLLVPEKHSDGAWHMHGFLKGLPQEHLKEFSTSDHIPYKILVRLQAGKRVFSWSAYSDKFGFSDIEAIENHEASSKYITKYITKDALRTISELGAHMYYGSKGLNHSEIITKDMMLRAIPEPDYANDYVSVNRPLM